MKLKDLVNKVREEKANTPKYLRDYDNFKFEVASLITEARLYSGFTQKELSELVNSNQPSVARWESGQSLPSLRSLKKMADALGTYLIPPKFGFMEEYKVEAKSSNNITVRIHTNEIPVNQSWVYNIKSSYENITLTK